MSPVRSTRLLGHALVAPASAPFPVARVRAPQWSGTGACVAVLVRPFAVCLTAFDDATLRTLAASATTARARRAIHRARRVVRVNRPATAAV
jgi:hypothetical protein